MLPVFVPIMTLVGKVAIGGGGGLLPRVKVTSRLAVPCDADVGVTAVIVWPNACPAASSNGVIKVKVLMRKKFNIFMAPIYAKKPLGNMKPENVFPCLSQLNREQLDAANDLALLKAVGAFKPLPIAASRTVKLGGTVATVGFPDIGLQGFAPKLTNGKIASLAGAADDPRYFQISLPVQPGNSGGALVDARGNVVGIVSAKLDTKIALDSTGALPENVNYAVKSSLLLSFLESVPEVSAKLKDPLTAERKFEDVVKSAQDAAVLVLVY